MSDDPAPAGISTEDWLGTPLAVRVLVLSLLEQVEQQRLAAVEERLNQNSRNSSKPPSADSPQTPGRPPRTASGRKAGGQPGHVGHFRPPKALSAVQQLVELRPTGCARCGTLLLGDDSQPERHQVTELPRIEAQLTEYRRHTLSCPLFVLWYRVRAGTLSRPDFQAAVLPLRAQVQALLQAGAQLAQAQTRHLCQNLLKLEGALWTFVAVDGIEPANNLAERGLRRAVLWRRRGFGTQSEAGSQFVARILTVVTTLRQRHRDVLNYLTDACQAAICGDKPPSLPPLST